MKRLLKFVARVAALAAALVLAAAIFPYAKDWLADVMPEGKYARVSTLLTHEMQAAGELTAVRHTDTGIMESDTNALFLGSVQKVTVPYAYEIGLGVSLADVRLTPTESGITVTVPPVRMLYDSFQVAGEPEVSDFWYHLTESRYQAMLDDQAAACRAGYLDNAEYQAQAWDAACDALRALLTQWAGEEVPFTFILPETQSAES